jgi:serpin B
MASSRLFKSLTVKLATLVLLTSVPGLLAQQGKANSKELSAVVNANNQFAFDFYRNLNAHEKEKNIFVSPYSISTALAMAFEGSNGNTRKQMAGVFHWDMPDAKRQAGFAALMEQTNPGPGKQYKLSVANALWGQKGYHFEPAFTHTIEKFYGGRFSEVDFPDDKPATIQEINTWVEDKTAGKIQDLIHPDDINELTRLVITNAIYFKGEWASQFNKAGTIDEPFHLSNGKTVQVPMMRQTGHFLFARENGLAVIELPYQDNDLSMIAILPDGDIEQMGKSLSLDDVQKLRAAMSPQEVDVFLPRFKFDTRYLVGSNLGAMGMPDAFSEGLADFSGITGKKDLYITSVIHQAMIDVNEEGSEAAAATAVVMGTKSIRIDQPETFRADRPFFFMIVHNATGSILFMGRVSNPPAEVAVKTETK